MNAIHTQIAQAGACSHFVIVLLLLANIQPLPFLETSDDLEGSIHLPPRNAPPFLQDQDQILIDDTQGL